MQRVESKGRVASVRLKRNVEVVFMSESENRVARVVWRALGRHIQADHKLEVRRLPEGEDLEISCCWCGGTVLAGSPGLVRQVVAKLKESGAKLVDVARSVGEAA